MKIVLQSSSNSELFMKIALAASTFVEGTIYC